MTHPAQSPKRDSTGVVVGVGIAAMLLIGGGTVAVALNSDDTHARAVPRDQHDSPPASGPSTTSPPGTGTAAPSSSGTAAPSESRVVTRLAKDYAAALSSDTAESLIEISCTEPTQEEVAAFNTEAAKSDFTYTLLGPPSVDGDVAVGEMRARQDTLRYRLRKTASGWCAPYEWSALLDGG